MECSILSSWRVDAGLLVETKQERNERLRLARFKGRGGERGQDGRVINPVRRVPGREHELDEVVWDEESETARAYRKVAREDTGWSVHEGRSGAANVSKYFPAKLGGECSGPRKRRWRRRTAGRAGARRTSARGMGRGRNPVV